jgi:cytochrome c oxidase cbb3-type subunit 4
MDLTHETLVHFAKSFGLFYLIAMSAIALIYAFWPSNQKRFEHAAKGILEGEDKPWR